MLTWFALRSPAAPLTNLMGALGRLTVGEFDIGMARVQPANQTGALPTALASYRGSLARGRALARAAEQQREGLRVAVASMHVGACMTDADTAVAVGGAMHKR